MANIDTYYRINAKAPLSDAILERIARVKRLSRSARTHEDKKRLGTCSITTNNHQKNASGR
jgi:hypothetical protein